MSFTKSGSNFQEVQSGELIWTSAWLCCATVPDLAITQTALSVDFGDIIKDNTIHWGILAAPPSSGDEWWRGYITARPMEYTYSDITLGAAPAGADFLRIKARVNRTTSPTSGLMCGALDVIPPVNQWVMVHGGFLPLEQAHPIARAIEIIDVSGTVVLRRIQSVGKSSLLDDSLLNWAIGNDQTVYTSTSGTPSNLGSFDWPVSKGQPIYYLGGGVDGSNNPPTQKRRRGGSLQMSLADPTSIRSVYAIDLDIEPGYFSTDAVLKAPAGKQAVRASYQYRNTISPTKKTSDTFTAVPIGLPDASRQVLCLIGTGVADNSSPKVASVTIGGIAATDVADAGTLTALGASIWMANVPSGTAADIVVTYATGSLQVSCLVYSLYHLNSTTPVAAVNFNDFGAGSYPPNPTAALATSNGGFAFAFTTHLDSLPGSAPPLLGGIANPGYHAMTIAIANSAGSFESAATAFEGAAQTTDGTTLNLVVAGQTNRFIATAGVSFF